MRNKFRASAKATNPAPRTFVTARRSALLASLSLVISAMFAPGAAADYSNPSGWGGYPYCVIGTGDSTFMWNISNGCTYANGTLKMRLTSTSGEYRLVFQSDGNLVVYRNGSSPVWQSGTAGKGATRIVFQKDGNVVIYRGSTTLWSSQTDNCNAGPGLSLDMQNDGNLVVYNYIWSTSPSSERYAKWSSQSGPSCH